MDLFFQKPGTKMSMFCPRNIIPSKEGAKLVLPLPLPLTPKDNPITGCLKGFAKTTQKSTVFTCRKFLYTCFNLQQLITSVCLIDKPNNVRAYQHRTSFLFSIVSPSEIIPTHAPSMKKSSPLQRLKNQQLLGFKRRVD